MNLQDLFDQSNSKSFWKVSDKTKAKRKETYALPEVKARKSAAAKESHARPEVKAKRKETFALPEVKARRSASLKEAAARPEVKARQSAAAKEANTRPEVKERRSAAIKEACARPEVRTKMSDLAKERWSHPEIKDKQKQLLNSPEVKAKSKEARLNKVPGVKTPLGYFESIKAAGLAYPEYKTGHYYIRIMMMKDPENFYEITREEYNEYVKSTTRSKI